MLQKKTRLKRNWEENNSTGNKRRDVSEHSASTRSTNDYLSYSGKGSGFTREAPWRPTQDRTKGSRGDSRAHQCLRDTDADSISRSPKRNVGETKISEAQATARASNWQGDERSTSRSYWQTGQWRTNDETNQHNEWQGHTWESASQRTLVNSRWSTTWCNANRGSDCRFKAEKLFRIYVCDHCRRPKTFQNKAFAFDGQFVSEDHRGRKLKDMEASWRKGEGDWRWYCTQCHQLPWGSV